jgi:hypothetical protein
VPYGAEVLPGSEQGLRRWVVAPFQGAVEFMGLGWIQGWRGTGERHALVTFCEPSGFGLASIRFWAFCSPDSRISSPLWRNPFRVGLVSRWDTLGCANTGATQGWRT